jgi:hypothetical protein
MIMLQRRAHRGFEFKFTSTRRVTRSMHVAATDLGLGRIDVIHPGPETFPLTDRIRAVALARIESDIDPL